MEWLVQLAEWSVRMVDYLGYPGIIFLMLLESSVFPVPSELVMPQAGYLVGMGKMNMVIVVACGVIGSWLGALLNYYVALHVGRPFFLRFGKYFFCPPHKFLKVEKFFLTHGEVGTFTGRLVPVVRHLISIPAGLARMSMGRFLFYTGTGSGIWVTILAYIGYYVQRVVAAPEGGTAKQLFEKYSKNCTIGVLAACVVIIVVYGWWHRRRQQRVVTAPGDLPPAA
jgi:membrane protein DedA with SNARE-associated domain